MKKLGLWAVILLVILPAAFGILAVEGLSRYCGRNSPGECSRKKFLKDFFDPEMRWLVVDAFLNMMEKEETLEEKTRRWARERGSYMVPIEKKEKSESEKRYDECMEEGYWRHFRAAVRREKDKGREETLEILRGEAMKAFRSSISEREIHKKCRPLLEKE